MSKHKIIGIYGCEQTDICIYLGSILENMNSRVLIIDNSFEQKMRFCIPRPDEAMSIITYKNVDYRTQTESVLWRDGDYDYTIINLGSWPDEEAFANCDELVCVIMCEKYELEKYRDLVAGTRIPVSLLFRNFCRSYMSMKGFRKFIPDDNCFILERLFLPFSEEDECCRMMMQYDGYHNFLNLSREFEKVLLHLCRTISEREFREIVNGMRRAKRGECL